MGETRAVPAGPVRGVPLRRAALLAAPAPPALLGVVAGTAGLGPAGWLVGLVGGWAATALVGSARRRAGQRVLPPADWVTLARAWCSAAVAGLLAGWLAAAAAQPAPTTALVTLATLALVLDLADGQVARRTGTATALGGRIDGETDAFLILLLSIAVCVQYGGWVLAIGAARYALLIAGWLVPWLAAPLPYRYWRKVVAATQGIVLTVAVSGLVDRLVGIVAVVLALALLAESFGRDVGWLYRSGAGRRSRLVVRRGAALLALVVVWAVLVAPDRSDRFTPAAFARLPAELLVLLALALVLPARPRRILGAVAGFLFGALTVIKIFDVGFNEELGRPFDPVLDWRNLGPAVGVVRDSIGAAATNVVLIGAVAGLIVLVGGTVLATVHLCRVAGRHRRGAVRWLAALCTVWALGAGLSWQLQPGTPLASASTATLAVDQVRDARAAVRDQQRFTQALGRADPRAATPASELLTGLRGKDVLIVFVESYGQVAVQGTSFSAGVDRVLRSGTAALRRAGWSAQSAWLTSPTFGGISWLAHSTLQSGLWVDSQQRYDQLMASDRFTLSDAFGKAGWRTVGDIPSNAYTWPDGTDFYHYDQLYDRRNVGYHGPTFSYASMPDQYTLAAFQRHELAPGHRPVMAEIDLVSSHTPWAPLPRMVPWDQVGDGSIFDPMPAQGRSVESVWRSTDTVREFYARSIQYSLRALTSWVTTQLTDPNLVLVVLGDHQPATTVSGPGANHEVPISVIAGDPAVFDRIAPWRWQDGLLPGPAAPRWPMDAFRDRFLDAFTRG